ncbi:MAG: GreA/GreB family elongation factor [Rhodoferax sp.]|nr:GreA/GreB family elongation factor [Rhodoferax sp.]MBP9931407.1 GreA/GreB family elongation factor [Rhodoferax sp.]HQX58932.1 GreA/GreB family elongation factor [Burkholderiaceae bacterium]HQZ07587.1 GreA/GreB family elongation factor [Burkholderiaceae bacterium]HRA61335.1 GreA/GreB family elongation factor [Burkholderiaceae bacterium]
MQSVPARGFERTLTELDFARLRKLANDKPPQWLTDLLDGVDILDARELPSDTVTMYSTVEFQDLYTGRRQQLTICYPNDAEPAAGFVSVLSPVGCALLGLRVGDVARWQTPSGEGGGAQILSVLFQPEASGDYSL